MCASSAKNSTIDTQPVKAESPKAISRPKIREITFDDYDQIAALATAHGLALTPTREEWLHRWIDNPAYLRHRNWPLGWVLDVDGKIVGHIGNIPSLYALEGRTLSAASGYAWVVRDEYRGYALLLLDKYLRQEKADLTLSNTATLESFHAHTQLGATPVPAGCWDRSSVWITSYSDFFRYWLGRKRVPAAELWSYPVTLILSAKDSWHRSLVAKLAKRSANVEIRTSFDEQFDRFWETLREKYPGKLLAFRDRHTLDWHFHYALRENRVWIFTETQGDELRSYAIFLIERNLTEQGVSPRALMVDFQSLGTDGIFFAMLRRALRQCREHGIHLLVTMGITAGGIDMSYYAPYHSTGKNPVFLFKVRDPKLAVSLRDSRVWCPTFFDGEASL